MPISVSGVAVGVAVSSGVAVSVGASVGASVASSAGWGVSGGAAPRPGMLGVGDGVGDGVGEGVGVGVGDEVGVGVGVKLAPCTAVSGSASPCATGGISRVTPRARTRSARTASGIGGASRGVWGCRIWRQCCSTIGRPVQRGRRAPARPAWVLRQRPPSRAASVAAVVAARGPCDGRGRGHVDGEHIAHAEDVIGRIVVVGYPPSTGARKGLLRGRLRPRSRPPGLCIRSCLRWGWLRRVWAWRRAHPVRATSMLSSAPRPIKRTSAAAISQRR